MLKRYKDITLLYIVCPNVNLAVVSRVWTTIRLDCDFSKRVFLAVITKKRTDRLPIKRGKKYIVGNAIYVNWQPILYNVKHCITIYILYLWYNYCIYGIYSIFAIYLLYLRYNYGIYSIFAI